MNCPNEPKWAAKLAVMEGTKHKTHYFCGQCMIVIKAKYPESRYLELGPLPVIIDRSFEQFKCQNCSKICLLPEMRFADIGDGPKIRYVSCIHCAGMLTIAIPTTGDISIFKSQPPYIYPDEVDSVAATGIKTTTDVYIRFNPYKGLYECRVGMVIMGSPNFESMVGACPFDGNYHDNICTGFGSSPGEAVEEMRKDMIKMADALWT